MLFFSLALDIAVSLMDLKEECELVTESRHAFGEKGEYV